MTISYKRVPTTLLFNRVNGIFVTAVGRPLDGFVYNQGKYIAREVEFNLKNDTVAGGLTIDGDEIHNDFKVVEKSDFATTIHERTLNMSTEKDITKKYPLVEQINILTNALISMIDKDAKLLKLESVQTLIEMKNFINTELDINNRRKLDCQTCESITYITDRELIELNNMKLKGLVDDSSIIKNTRVFKTD